MYHWYCLLPIEKTAHLQVRKGGRVMSCPCTPPRLKHWRHTHAERSTRMAVVTGSWISLESSVCWVIPELPLNLSMLKPEKSFPEPDNEKSSEAISCRSYDWAYLTRFQPNYMRGPTQVISIQIDRLLMEAVSQVCSASLDGWEHSHCMIVLSDCSRSWLLLLPCPVPSSILVSPCSSLHLLLPHLATL